MALQVIGAASGEATFTLGERCAAQALIGGTNVVIARRDQTGETGLELIMPVEHAAAVWDQLLATDAAIGHGRRRVRPIGWHSFNIARIEAGTPLFNVDFGTTSLPHETGVLHDRVSFTKGCYLGQEIVARTEHLGRPKLNLIGLRMQANRLPVAGAQVFAAAGEGTAGSIGDQIGVVTSSTLSPMLGAAPIAFAMVRASHAEIGRAVVVNAEGESCAAVIHPLRFWPGPEPSSP
jgi:folate-binding protein YgfZ